MKDFLSMVASLLMAVALCVCAFGWTILLPAIGLLWVIGWLPGKGVGP